MDFRLGSTISKYLEENGYYDDCDMISVAGAAKSIAEENESFVEAQIDLSKRLHNIQKVILMNHTDCGGYGGRSAFDSDEAEREAHTQDLQTAKERMLAKYPDLTIKTALAVVGEGGKVHIEEIE